MRELRLQGMRVVEQASFQVNYKGQCVGEYFGDLVVEDTVVVELKCVDRFCDEHMAQCLNYLKASGMGICLLVNFQKPSVEWRRILLGNG